MTLHNPLWVKPPCPLLTALALRGGRHGHEWIGERMNLANELG